MMLPRRTLLAATPLALLTLAACSSNPKPAATTTPTKQPTVEAAEQAGAGKESLSPEEADKYGKFIPIDDTTKANARQAVLATITLDTSQYNKDAWTVDGWKKISAKFKKMDQQRQDALTKDGTVLHAITLDGAEYVDGQEGPYAALIIWTSSWFAAPDDTTVPPEVPARNAGDEGTRTWMVALNAESGTWLIDQVLDDLTVAGWD